SVEFALGRVVVPAYAGERAGRGDLRPQPFAADERVAHELHAGDLDHPALGDAEHDPRVARLIAFHEIDAGIEPALILELAEDGLLGDPVGDRVERHAAA